MRVKIRISKEDKVNWVIYKLESPSGKVYIGKTCNFKERIRMYKNLFCKSQKLLYKSLLKYGLENHKIEFLSYLYGDNYDSSKEEIRYISEFKTNRTKYKDGIGLNLSDGGEGVVGRIYTQEEKDKMKGRKHSIETRIKISEVQKGRISPMKGKKVLNPEIGKKIALSKIGKKLVVTKKRTSEMKEHQRKLKISLSGKTIVQCNFDGSIIKEFPAKRIAAKELGISRTTIKDILNGIRKYTKLSYTLRYKHALN